MSPDERRAFRDEGLSAERRAQFRAALEATRAWERLHPWTLDDSLDFLDDFQAVFGPIAVDRAAARGDDFRL